MKKQIVFKKKKCMKIISVVLSVVMMITSMPLSAFTENVYGEVLYGDVNGDGKINNQDVYLLEDYLKDLNSVSDFNNSASDTNNDGVIDQLDVLHIKKYLANWRIFLGPKVYTLKFDTDGGTTVLPMNVYNGQQLGKIPTTSKEGYTFIGWSYDKEGKNRFYADSIVVGETDKNFITLYAQYEQSSSKLEDIKPSLNVFTLMNQKKDLSFEIVSNENLSIDDVASKIELQAIDGSEVVKLEVENNGEKCYIVKAVDGFNEGCSYTMTLADGLTFKDKVDTIRMVSFTIYKKEVSNLQVNTSNELKDTDSIDYIITKTDKNGQTTTQSVPVLEVGLINNTESQYDVKGSFNYQNAPYKIGDVICIYEKYSPKQRADEPSTDYTQYAIAYVKITNVTPTQVEFRNIKDDEIKDVLAIPDIIPIKSTLSNITTITTDKILADFDSEAWAGMGKTTTITTADDIKKLVTVGDFIVIYQDDFADIDDDSVVQYYLVTSLDGSTYTLKPSSQEEIDKSMDLFKNTTMSGDALIDGVNKEELENEINGQLLNSDFANKSALILTDLTLSNKQIQEKYGVESITFVTQDGQLLSKEQVNAIMTAKNVTISPDIPRVEITKNTDHLDSGVHLGIELGATITLKHQKVKNASLKIKISASFVEEIGVKVNVKANAKWKWYAFIPVLKDVDVTTNIDVKNYSGVSIDIRIFTVEVPDDYKAFEDLEKEGGETLKEYDQAQKDADEQIKEVDKQKAEYQQIENKIGEYPKNDETKKELDSLKAQAETTKANAAKAEANWKGLMEKSDNLKKSLPEGFDLDKYKALGQKLDQYNVVDTFKTMTGLSDQNQVSAGVKNIAEKYQELMKNDSDWVDLFRKNILSKDINPDSLGIVQVGINLDFVIQAKVNLALGLNMEYVVGKRYSFKVSVLSFKASSDVMDIMDEQFGFQFYVMGMLGIRLGVEVKACVGLFSTKLDSIGIVGFVGPYVKLNGYFVYEYTRYRPQGEVKWMTDEKLMGALYLDFGISLQINFEAQVLNGKFKYSPKLCDKYFSLLHAGEQENVQQFATELPDGVKLYIKDEDANSNNGYTMLIPEHYLQMEVMDMLDGTVSNKCYSRDKYKFSCSSQYFKYDDSTGKVTVTPPEGKTYLESDLIVTWKADKLAFSKYDISLKIPLVWTNLSDKEMQNPYTVRVLAGNTTDGYKVVYTTQALKGVEFNIPTQEEIRDKIGYNLYKYAPNDGYKEGQQTQGLSVNQDTDIYYNMQLRSYSITIDNIQNDDATTTSKTFTVKYGQQFNFDSIKNTGTNNDVLKDYTIFNKIKASSDRDISDNINESFAKELVEENQTYTAEYVPNSVEVKFEFVGADIEDTTVIIKKGTVPMDSWSDTLAEQGKLVDKTSEEIAPFYTDKTIFMYCKDTDVPRHTITFESNGGSSVADIKTFEGGKYIIPNNPEKYGYEFAGWYSDSNCTQPYALTGIMQVMDSEVLTLYAKWEAKTIKVTFETTVGQIDGVKELNPKFGEQYSQNGEFPKISDPNFRLVKWVNKATNEEVTPNTIITTLDNIILVAVTEEKYVIDPTKFSCENITNAYVYQKNKYSFNDGLGHNETSDFYKLLYRKQGSTDNEWKEVIEGVGTYDVQISRETDDWAKAFKLEKIGYFTITKGTRTLDSISLSEAYCGVSQIDYYCDVVDCKGKMTLKVAFGTTSKMSSNPYDKEKKLFKVSGLTPKSSVTYKYTPILYINDDPNYFDFTNTYSSITSETKTKNTQDYSKVVDKSYVDDVLNYQGTTYLVDSTEKFVGMLLALETDKTINITRFEIVDGLDFTNCGYIPTIKLGKERKITIATLRGDGSIFDYYDYRSRIIGLQRPLFQQLLNGYRIENLSIDDCFFGTSDVSVSSDGDLNVGAIANETLPGSIIERCEACVYITDNSREGTTHNIGSIVGVVKGWITIADATSYGKITISQTTKKVNLGGVVGLNNELINYCYNYTRLIPGDARYINVGGIVGLNRHEVYRCDNYADITGGASTVIGGIAGQSKEPQGPCSNQTKIKVYGNDSYDPEEGQNDIWNCNNYGNIVSRSYTSSIVSQLPTGGIVGLTTMNVKECENYGDVTSYGNKVGGIVGLMSYDNNNAFYVYKCKNFGKVSAKDSKNGVDGDIFGGIAGAMTANTNIDSCINFGDVKARSHIGGIVGMNTGGSIVNSSVYYANITIDTLGQSCYNCNDYAGGIVGYNSNSDNYKSTITGYIKNCAVYFINIDAPYTYTGGIVGSNMVANARVYNCLSVVDRFNAGSNASSDSKYYGLVVGRNNKNSGEIRNNYYYSATNTDKGVGNKNGYTADNVTNCYIARFTSFNGKLISKTAELNNKVLIDQLNNGKDVIGVYTSGENMRVISQMKSWTMMSSSNKSQYDKYLSSIGKDPSKLYNLPEIKIN